MSTIDKILAMIATVQEMRKILAKDSSKDEILEKIAQNGSMGQTALIAAFPEMSSRTVRRHLELLLQRNKIVRQKSGREVTYIIHNRVA